MVLKTEAVEVPVFSPGGLYRHWRIDEEIARGGMGVVYRATDLHLDRVVAIKAVRPSLATLQNGTALKRFRIEAGVHMGERNPNLPALHDFDTLPDGTGVFVFEWLDGRDLDATIRCVRRVPLGDALFVTTQIVRALAPMHGDTQGKILHRDIKPSNVFVCRRPVLDAHGRIDRERVRLLDFGVAKVAAFEAVTTDDTVLGTAHYMSPEQVRGEKLDARSDLHAVGAVLYEMLAGHPVFVSSNNDDPRTFQIKQLTEPPPDLRSELPLPDDVWWFVARLLAPKRDNRFASTAETLAAAETLERAHRDTAELFRDDVDDVIEAMDRLRARGKARPVEPIPSSRLAALAARLVPTEPTQPPSFSTLERDPAELPPGDDTVRAALVFDTTLRGMPAVAGATSPSSAAVFSPSVTSPSETELLRIAALRKNLRAPRLFRRPALLMGAPGETGRMIEITGRLLSIGSGIEAHLRLDAPALDPLHIGVGWMENGRLAIAGFDTTSDPQRAVRVDGEAVRAPADLIHGCTLDVGETRFQVVDLGCTRDGPAGREPAAFVLDAEVEVVRPRQLTRGLTLLGSSMACDWVLDGLRDVACGIWVREDGLVEVTLIDTEDLAAGGDGLRAARAVESGELTPLGGGESLMVTK